MSRLGGRLERLRDRAPAKLTRPLKEEELKRVWLRDQGYARERARLGPDEWQVIDQFRILVNKGLVTTFEATRDRILEVLGRAKPVPEHTVERALALLIYRQEKGALDMVCPERWRSSFVAAEELARLHAKIPTPTLARWIVAASEAGPEQLEEVNREERREQSEEYGLTEELLAEAVGPDLQEIEQEEVTRRIEQAIPDYYYGERGVEAVALAARIIEKRSQNG